MSSQEDFYQFSGVNLKKYHTNTRNKAQLHQGKSHDINCEIDSNEKPGSPRDFTNKTQKKYRRQRQDPIKAERLYDQFQDQKVRFLDGFCQTQENNVKKQAKESLPSQKQGNLVLLILNCIFTLNVACQNILFFFTSESDFKYYYLAPSIGVMIVFFLLNSIYMAKSFKQFLLMQFMLDTILLTQIIASIGFVGLMKSAQILKWHVYFAFVAVPLLHFLLSGNIRILILNNNWNRKRTILFKSVVMVGSIVFFCIGAYIMLIDYKITSGLFPSIDSTFKDFALLYTFASCSFFNEIFCKISDFDKTSDLLVQYSIKIDENQYLLPQKSQYSVKQKLQIQSMDYFQPQPQPQPQRQMVSGSK